MLNQKLETLLAVNELRSYTKAADLLHLTQPAVSQQIRSLEDEFGAKIFIRSENSIKITPEGEIVVRYASRIKTLYANLMVALKDKKKNLRHLTVGLTKSAEMSIVTRIFAEYSAANPNVHITIVSDDIENLYNKLKIYQVDLIIVDGDAYDTSFNTILLDADHLILAVSKDNPLSRESSIDLSRLKREKLILRLPSSGTRRLFESQLSARGESLAAFNVILEVDNISTIKELVKNNFGVSILANSACSNELKKGEFRALSIENVTMVREINLIYHKDFEYDDILCDVTKLYTEESRKYNY